jgi:hypothetical protein
MKALALILIASTAFAGTASIVSSFRSPAKTVAGIDYYNGYIYHACQNNGIYETTTSGSNPQMIPTRYAGLGLDRTTAEYWTCLSYAITRLDTEGKYIKAISAPHITRGVTFGATHVWTTGEDNRINKITVNGSPAGSFALPGCNPYGICYSDDELWLAERSKGGIWHVTTTGSLIESYDIPQTPWGVACEGRYIWYSVDANGYVYKALPIPTPVAPESLGKVKALYK